VVAEATFGHAIRLVGFDPPPATVDPARPVPIMLYWQALASDIPTGYTVFVHLLADDGRLIAQSDAVPAGGARSTNEWLEGEYVSDTHEWSGETGYSGLARLSGYTTADRRASATAEGDDLFAANNVTVAPAP
jgi:hypothetical protein